MENKNEETVFKVPKLLFGPRPGIKKPIKSIPNAKSLEAIDDESSTSTNLQEDPKNKIEPTIEPQKKVDKLTCRVPIPYEEPSWGGKPGDKYFLEV